MADDVEERPMEVLLALNPFAPLTDAEEFRIREHFGYASSETRTRAQRQQAADRMLAGKPRIRMEIVGRDLHLPGRPDFGRAVKERE